MEVFLCMQASTYSRVTFRLSEKQMEENSALCHRKLLIIMQKKNKITVKLVMNAKIQAQFPFIRNKH